MRQLLLSTFIILFFRFFYLTDGERWTISENERSNKFRVDSVEVTGDCCVGIEANNDEYKTVDPENPRVFLNTTFYIHKIYAHNSC